MKALMKLRSKHVVQIFDIVQSKNGTIGIVQEYLTGQDLLDSPFPKASPENYLKTLWQIAAGLADIHEANVIHRDIKPNNMKFDDEGIIKIFDFGLARNEGPEANTMGYKGTPIFSAPELFTTDRVDFSTAIDTYAFAVSAIVLSGANIPKELMNLPPHPLPADCFSVHPISLNPELVESLSKCVSHDPNLRPPMAEIRDLLSRILLRGKHQALAVYNNAPNILNKLQPLVNLKYGDIAEIKIEYDGLRFHVTETNGEVFVNNKTVTVNKDMPGSSVITLGAQHRRNNRSYITFDVSNPEVVL
jgi:serine/threonine-protein kinase